MTWIVEILNGIVSGIIVATIIWQRHRIITNLKQRKLWFPIFVWLYGAAGLAASLGLMLTLLSVGEAGPEGISTKFVFTSVLLFLLAKIIEKLKW